MRRQHRIGDSEKPRERNSCPVCNSLDVSKRIQSKDYICRKCKWRGKNINRILV